MNGDPREIGRFALGLNEGIPVEIIIMQLRAFVKSHEKGYFSAFEKGV